MNTNTHFSTQSGCEGPCCLDCAAATGSYRDLLPGEAGFGLECTSCRQMLEDAQRDEAEMAREDAELDAIAEGMAEQSAE